MPVRLLIVDDSATMRAFLRELLAGDPDIDVIGEAGEASTGLSMVRDLAPDLVTLDVLMPGLDGLSFLKNLMRQHPVPVIMISNLAQRGTDVALRALELGAVDVIGKPNASAGNDIARFQAELNLKIKAAAQTFGSRDRRFGNGSGHAKSRRARERIVAIGASTGGIVALKEVLVSLPPDCPAVLIAQHILPGFSRRFAARMDDLCRVSVKEAKDGEKAVPGHVYIAPGDRHMTLTGSAGSYFCRLADEPPVNGHRPSIDLLFGSVAAAAGSAAIGVVMTGMGRDGAEGLLQMRKAGGATAAQDEATSLIYGMPKAAMTNGAGQHSLPLREISSFILDRRWG